MASLILASELADRLSKALETFDHSLRLEHHTQCEEEYIRGQADGMRLALRYLRDEASYSAYDSSDYGSCTSRHK